jgi:hypothetical protein
MKNLNKYIKPESVIISTPELMQVGPNANASKNGNGGYTIIDGAKESTWDDYEDDNIWSETEQKNTWSEQ